MVPLEFLRTRWIGFRRACLNFHFEFDDCRLLGINHVEDSLERELLEVIARSVAADHDPIGDHFDLQRPNPSCSSFRDPMPDSLLALWRPQPVVSFCGLRYIPVDFATVRYRL